MKCVRNKEYLTLLVKPTHKCNMNCSYCYDRIYRETVKDDMSLEDIREIARKTRGASNYVNWIWHGGEVLVLGKEWFKAASKIIKEELDQFLGTVSLQSNGLLIDDEWIDIFIKEQVSLGVSYDGIHHNESRADNADKVRANIIKCKDRGLKVGIISVLTIETLRDWKLNVAHFEEMGLNSFSFNIIHPDKIGSLKFDATDEDEYINNMQEYFDFVLYNRSGIVDRNVDAFILNMLGSDRCVCNQSDCTGKFLGIAPNGIIYPCDRYYPERYILGNFKDYESITEAFQSEGYINLIADRTARRQHCKDTCILSDFCQGGCNATVLLYSDGKFDKVNNSYCYYYHKMFRYIFDKFKNISKEEVEKLNSYYYKLLLSNGYISLSTIQEALEER